MNWQVHLNIPQDARKCTPRSSHHSIAARVSDYNLMNLMYRAHALWRLGKPTAQAVPKIPLVARHSVESITYPAAIIVQKTAQAGNSLDRPASESSILRRAGERASVAEGPILSASLLLPQGDL